MKTLKRLSALFLGLILCVVLAACGETKTTPLDDAATYLHQMYKDDTITASSYELVDTLVVGEEKFTVEWSKTMTTTGNDDSVTLGAAKDHIIKVTIAANKTTPTKIEYTLTAKVSSTDGKSKTLTFDKYIPAYVVNTHQEWTAAKKGDSLMVRGAITAKSAYSASNKNVCVWLQDDNGGYYAYRLKCETAEANTTDLAIGNVIDVKGTASPYNGWLEMAAGCSYEVYSTTPKTYEYKDIQTAIAASATDMAPYQNQKVTFSGVVREIVAADKYGQKSFKMDIGTRENVLMYVKYGENGPIDKAAHDEIFEDLKIGYTVTVKGIEVWYNAVQFHPIEVEVTSKVIAPKYQALTSLSSVASVIKTNYYVSASASFKIIDVYDTDPALTFEVTEGDQVVTITEASCSKTVSGSKVYGKRYTINVSAPTAATTVKIKVTATVGTGEDAVTEFTTITSKVEKMDTVSKINTVTTEGKTYMIEGRIVAKDGSGRPYLQDDTGVILVYNNPSTIKTLAIGTKIKVIGSLSLYNGMKQFGYDSLELVGEPVADATTIDYGTPTTYTAAEYDQKVVTDKDSTMSGKYVKVTGYSIKLSGSYINATYTKDGTAVDVQLQFDASVKTEFASLLTAGTAVTVYGYSYGTNGTVGRLTVTKVEAAA